MTAAAPRRGARLLVLSLLLLVLAFVWLLAYAYHASANGADQTLDGLYRAADQGRVASATLLDEDAVIVGQLTDRACGAQTVTPTGGGAPIPMPCPGPYGDFRAAYPRSDVATQTLINKVTATGGRVDVDKQTLKGVAKLLVSFVLPLLVLANLFGLIFLARGGGGSLGELTGLGGIRRGANRGSKERGPASGVTFADVAGVDEVITELREVTDYLREPKKYAYFKAAAPKGVMLFGPPGCGKTLLARAVAGESHVPFFSISGAEFVEALVGVGAARARDLFRQVREAAPAILFIDEIDAVGRRRAGEGVSGGEREQTVNQLLVEMDGFEVSSGVVVMAATNRPDILDPALLRPGRFDRHVTLEPPNVEGRRAILAVHARGKPMAEDVDFESLARQTPGFTGADLANVINEAALLAIREITDRSAARSMRITSAHLTEAVLRVLHGPQRRGRMMSVSERKRVAFHESGHALVATALGHTQVHRLSVVARGRGLGQSLMGEEGDRTLLTRSQMEAELTTAVAGLTAERLVFGEESTAAEDDIDRATRLAREMIGRHGMSPQLGTVRLLSRENGHLGADPVLEVASGQTLHEFDQEVRQLMAGARERAEAILGRHRDQLDKLAAVLELKETVDGAALEVLLAPVRP